jgi:hypothetical protein
MAEQWELAARSRRAAELPELQTYTDSEFCIRNFKLKNVANSKTI